MKKCPYLRVFFMVFDAKIRFATVQEHSINMNVLQKSLILRVGFFT